MGGPMSERLGNAEQRQRAQLPDVHALDGPARSASPARAPLLSARNCRIAASPPRPFLLHAPQGTPT